MHRDHACPAFPTDNQQSSSHALKTKPLQFPLFDYTVCSGKVVGTSIWIEFLFVVRQGGTPTNMCRKMQISKIHEVSAYSLIPGLFSKQLQLQSPSRDSQTSPYAVLGEWYPQEHFVKPTFQQNSCVTLRSGVYIVNRQSQTPLEHPEPPEHQKVLFMVRAGVL